MHITILNLVELFVMIICCLIGNLYCTFKTIKNTQPDLKDTDKYLNLKDSVVIGIHMTDHNLISNIMIAQPYLMK